MKLHDLKLTMHQYVKKEDYNNSLEDKVDLRKLDDLKDAMQRMITMNSQSLENTFNEKIGMIKEDYTEKN